MNDVAPRRGIPRRSDSVLRLDLPQRMMHTIGVFPRADLIDRVELSVDGDSLRVERAFWHRGTLGLRASLTRAGLTLPLEVPGGVENAFVPAGEIDSWHGGVAGCL